ncbi:MAG: T9SS type A sorting domain-containing protein [Saprospiraceae bacterium]|nr:T9SS type A sorting domain-containing protein [Saprospiraceae bacterium]
MKPFFTILFLFFAVFAMAQDRNQDPVVLRGNVVPCMVGIAPNNIVAFRFNGSWQQIPMQVDEIVVKDIKTPYGPNDCVDRSSENVAWTAEFYADDNTYTGSDNDLSFDSNDELVFMAKDAGQKSNTNACPNGVISSSKCEITVRDPLNNTIWGYVYLFQQNGTLQQSAGKSYVSYNYSYKDNYKNTYKVCVFSGTNNNPENSLVSTSEYEVGFSQRWVEDVLRIKAGGANQKDILDRHQIFINESACNRNEQVFSDGKGPIITNKVGPVRAIRSVMGAASGTFTEEVIRFTQYRADYTIYYRLHTANGYNDVFDFSSDAIGMTYYNNRNTQGVTINGNQDNIDISQVNNWELITGAQGSLVTSFSYKTDIRLGTEQQYQSGSVQGNVRAYYSDAGTAARYTCTGDGRQYGSTGFALETDQCTDPRADFDDYPECQPQFVKFFTEQRIHYYLAPNLNTTQASKYGMFGQNPLTGSALAMGGCSGGGSQPTCTDGIQNGTETGVDCGGSCPACPTQPTCTDGIQNGTETGVDCGGSCPACAESCEVPTGLFVNNNTGTEATFNWSPVVGAVSYSVQYRKVGARNWKVQTTTETSFVVTGLRKNKMYEWRVQSNCGDRTSEWSATQTFTAGSQTAPSCTDGIQNGSETGIDCGGSCPACEASACETPTGLVTNNIETNRATLSWNAVSGAFNYTLQVRVRGAATWTTKNVTTTTSIARPLMPNTTYEWRVSANCNEGTSEWSDIVMFRTPATINNLANRSTNNNIGLEVIIYPIPVTDELTIQASQPIQKISLFDVTGRILHVITLDETSFSSVITTAQLASGSYFISVQTETGVATNYFSKE